MNINVNSRANPHIHDTYPITHYIYKKKKNVSSTKFFIINDGRKLATYTAHFV